MKRKFLPCVLLIFGMSAISCSNRPSLIDDIDNYFREKAVNNFSSVSSYSPFYRMVCSDKEAFDGCFIEEDGVYTSVFSGKEASCRGSKLQERSNQYMSWYSFEARPNVLYDAFLNEIHIDNYFGDELPSFTHYYSIIRRGGNAYRDIFNIDSSTYVEDGLELIDILSFDNYYLYKLSSDTAYDFSNSSYSLDIEVLNDPLHIFKESEFEYRVSFKTGDCYYYINKSSRDDRIYKAYVSDRNLSSSYIRLFDLKFVNFDYYYYLERVDDVTNKFDFFFNEDYEKAYGIPFPAGNYRIHSSHQTNYLPMRLYLSENHNYAFALCLRISEDKLLLPEFNAVKIENNGKISGFTKEVELMVSNISYINFKNNYILVNYSDLSLIKPDYCYVLTSGNQSHIYTDPNSDYISINGSLVSSITPENKLLFLKQNTNASVITMFDIVTKEQKAFSTNKMFDEYNLLYASQGKLFFQYYELGNYNSSSSIRCVFSNSFTVLKQEYKSLVYQVDDSYINICCRGDIHE